MANLLLDGLPIDIPQGIPIILVEKISTLSQDEPYANLMIFTSAQLTARNIGSQRHKTMYPVELSKVDVGSFMSHFAFCEALSIGILALHHANSIGEYFNQWRLVDEGKIDLYRRMKLIEDIRKKHYPSVATSVKGIQDLRDVRNQLVHTLYPLTVRYRSKDYATRDTNHMLRRALSADLTKEIYNLLLLYKYLQDHKLSNWLSEV